MLKHEEAQEQMNPAPIRAFTVAYPQQEVREEHSEAERTTTAAAPMQQEYTANLMAKVQAEARRYRRARTFTRGCASAMIILMSLMVLVFLLRGLIQGKWDWDVVSSLSSFTCMFGAAVVASSNYRNAAGELAQVEDLRAVGPLAECLEIEEKSVREQVEGALVRLLPRLQASDAGLLNTQQRATLNKSLYGKNDALKVAILRAWEQVGDAAALPYVEALAREPADTPAPMQMARAAETSLHMLAGPKVRRPASQSAREAAQACLPFLRERIELQRASQTLLRGASASVQPDTLLRAVHPDASSRPEQLLRPASDSG